MKDDRAKLDAVHIFAISSLVIVIALTLGGLVAGLFQVISWPVFFCIIKQTLFGIIFGGVVDLLGLRKNGIRSVLLRVVLLLMFIVGTSLILTIWPWMTRKPEMSFIAEFLAELGLVAGGVMGVTARRLPLALTGKEVDQAARADDQAP